MFRTWAPGEWIHLARIECAKAGRGNSIIISGLTSGGHPERYTDRVTGEDYLCCDLYSPNGPRGDALRVRVTGADRDEVLDNIVPHWNEAWEKCK